MAFARSAISVMLLAVLTADCASGSEVACPALEDGYTSCVQDAQDPACMGFVRAAALLGENFQDAARNDALIGASLRTRNWWGCKPDNLDAIAALLRRIDTPAARDVLAGEPYASLLGRPGLRPREPLTPPEISCEEYTQRADLIACAGRQRDAAEAGRKQIYARCLARISTPLAGQLEAGEAAWEQNVRIECGATAGDEIEQSRCLANAASERTQGLLAAHPECATAP